MSKAQIEFLQRCKALNLHSGSLNDWLDRIEAQQKRIEDILALLSEQGYEYNRKTNQLIKRHANQLAASQAQIKVLREALEKQIVDAKHCQQVMLNEVGIGFLDVVTLANSEAALALPQDDSALQAAILAEREACAVVCEASRRGLEKNEAVWREHPEFKPDDELIAQWETSACRGEECAAAIRARGDMK